MCEPSTIAIIGTAASVLGTAASAYSSVQQGNASAAAANYKAAVDRNNAQTAANNATAAENIANNKVQAQMRAGEQRAGAQRAALGAAGVALDSGSSLDLQSATAGNTAIETQNTDYQGKLTAYGYRTQQNSYVNQGTLDTMSADNATTAGYLSAGGTVLSGAGQVASKWYAMNKGSGSNNVGYNGSV